MLAAKLGRMLPGHHAVASAVTGTVTGVALAQSTRSQALS
jgi:hypothetical protein